MKISSNSIAYAAGLLDGEGCIAVYEYPTKLGFQQVRFDVQISNTDTRPLIWMRDTFGGSLSRRGGIKRANCRECYYWHIMNAKAAEFLKMVRPFCKIKSEQIDAALEFRTTYAPQTGVPHSQEVRAKRRQIIGEIASLKRRSFSMDGEVVH
jgi:hypothetical protein